jgi:putative hydrolase of the HAD superfamily
MAPSTPTPPTPTPPTRAPRAILFDAGNTLIRIDYAAIADALAGHGHARDLAAIEDAELRARVRLDPHLAPGASTESGDTHGRYLRYLLERLDVTDDAEVAAMERWRRDYNAPVGLWTRADPRAAAALARARAAGLAVGVISNSNGTVRRTLEVHGLAAHIDFLIDSSEVGVEKPDPRIFGLGLARVGVAAAEAAYVGDLYSVDVLGARAAGLAAVLIDPRGYWGARDCLRARDAEHAVAILLGERI